MKRNGPSTRTPRLNGSVFVSMRCRCGEHMVLFFCKHFADLDFIGVFAKRHGATTGALSLCFGGSNTALQLFLPHLIPSGPQGPTVGGSNGVGSPLFYLLLYLYAYLWCPWIFSQTSKPSRREHALASLRLPKCSLYLRRAVTQGTWGALCFTSLNIFEQARRLDERLILFRDGIIQ